MGTPVSRSSRVTPLRRSLLARLSACFRPLSLAALDLFPLDAQFRPARGAFEWLSRTMFCNVQNCQHFVLLSIAL